MIMQSPSPNPILGKITMEEKLGFHNKSASTSSILFANRWSKRLGHMHICTADEGGLLDHPYQTWHKFQICGIILEHIIACLVHTGTFMHYNESRNIAITIPMT